MKAAGTVLAILILFSPASGSAATTVIRAERAFTGLEIVEDVVIVIEDELIRAVVPSAGFTPIEGSTVIDAAGTTVSPGFIDSHVHILSMPLAYLKDVSRYGWGRLAEQMRSQVPQNRRELLEGGITTVYDMGAPLDSVARMSRDLASGAILGPDVFYAGPLFTAFGGHPAGTIYRGQHSLIDTATVQVSRLEPALAAAVQLASTGASFLKLVYDDGSFYGGKVPRLDLELAGRISEFAHAAGLRVIAHVGALESGFADMVGIGVDGVEHCFAYDGSDAVFQDMAARGVTLTPTLSIYELFAPGIMPRMLESVRTAAARGVPISVGTDFPSTRFMNAAEGYFRELALLEQAGLPRVDVLRAATVNAARKLGKDDEIGLLRPGLRANIVLIDGDIREGPISRERIRAVLLHGNPVVMDRRLVEGRQRGFRRSSFMVSPYGFHDPVAGFSAGLSAIAFNLFDTGIAANLNLAYAFSGHLGTELSLSPPCPIPSTTLGASLSFDDYPRRFFGVGNDSVLADALAYGSRSIRISLTTTTTLAKTAKISTQFLFDDRTTEGLHGQPVPAVTGGAGGMVTLAGVQVAHDTRDAPGAPWRGDYEAVSFGVSHPSIGSDFTFVSLGLDLRCFFSVAHGHVLAGRFLYRQCFGDAPFCYLPDFGGSTLGRGFQPGRFIGDIVMAGQLEYRFPIWSVLGGVLFLDGGQARDALPSFTVDGFHVAGGAGLRVAFSDTSILAFDFGFTGEPLDAEGWSLAFRYGNAF